MKWFHQTAKRNGQHRETDRIRIGTLNIMTLNTTASEIVDIMNEENIDLLCIQELRVGEATLGRFRRMSTKSGLVFYCGAATRGAVLIAVLCRRHLATARLDQQEIGFRTGWPYEDNATFIKVEDRNRIPLLLASCSGPHYEQDARQIYDDMGAVLAARARCYLIMGGTQYNRTTDERPNINVVSAGAFHTLDDADNRSVPICRPGTRRIDYGLGNRVETCGQTQRPGLRDHDLVRYDIRHSHIPPYILAPTRRFCGEDDERGEPQNCEYVTVHEIRQATKRAYRGSMGASEY